NQKATSCTLIGNLTPGRYLWRVNVNGAQAPRSWLLIMTPPVPKAPVMGLPLANGFVNDNTPMLTWTDAPSGPATPYTYEVQVDNDSSFASPVLTRSDIGGNLSDSNTSSAGWEILLARPHIEQL
ncbi:MAG TPA: hypothetical protein VHO69_01035, partial [Phototrophicaceae bacterium]|nr:hypothetical protein [Phototrophicaceae bacterium]